MQFSSPFNKKIKIGVLTPYSSIYPQLIPSVVNGFYSALPPKYQDHFEFIPEYVKQGEGKMVSEAVQKLIQFHNVDIISGLVSYKSVPEIIPIIENANKIGFLFDIGEYIPYTHHICDSVFFNSMYLWQSEFALGKWSHNKFGEKGAILMPIYDAGYHLHSAFRQGTISAGANIIDYVTLPYTEKKSQVTGQIENIMKTLETNQPSYIHALFCGNEAVEFLNAYQHSKLSDSIPLIISEHMASEEILDQISHLNMNMYSASLWDYNLATNENQIFKNGFINQSGSKANIFALMGYEFGMACKSLHNEFLQKDWSKIKIELKNIVIDSPRGKIGFNHNDKNSTPHINIENIKLGNNQIQKLIIEQSRSLKYSDQIFNEIHKENVTGWLNPYLCV